MAWGSRPTLSPRRRGLRSGVFGRAGWSLVDQALSSLSNAALSLLVAKVAGPAGYGAFAVAFTVFTFLQGVSRGLVNNPYLMRYAAVGDERAAAESGAGTGLALLFGVASGAVVLAAAAVLGGDAAAPLIVMAVALPGLLVQDVWRSIFVARQRPQRAAANDALWAALQFTVLGVLVVTGTHNPVPYIAGWGLTGAVAAVLAVLWGRARPSVRRALPYARSTHDLSRYLVAEWLTVLGAAQLALLAVGAMGTLADVGSLRASQTLLGPLTIMVVATFGFVVPELVRRPHLGRREMRLAAAGVSTVLSVFTLCCGAVLHFLPDRVGHALLGQVWPGAQATLPAMTLWMVGATLAVGPIAVIRACGQAKASFRVNLLIGGLLLVCTPIGFLMGGAPGAAAGFAVANLLPVPLFWWQLEVVLRHRSEAN